MFGNRLTFSSLLVTLFVVCGLITACTNEVIVPTPVSAITVDPNATSLSDVAIPTPLPPLQEEASNSTPESSPEELEVEQKFAEDLGLQLSPDGTSGIQAITAFETTSPNNSASLWIAYTVGIRSFDPLQNHAVAVYQKGSDGWLQIALYEMADPVSTDNAGSETEQALAPDYLGVGSIFPVTVEPDRLWLQVEGGVGAHSGIFALLSFDGTTIKQEATAFSASPGAGSVQDVNGDGIGEAILDNSDYYVFCYACGVRAPNYSILRWDGTAMVPVETQSLPADAPATLLTLNERMIEQASAGLWKDALNTSGEIAAQSISDPSGIQQWNVAWVQINGEARRVQAESESSAYLLLDQVFYGDFATAVDAMRGYDAQSIFNPNSPLIVGTVAEGSQESLSNTLLTNVEAAINLYADDAATAPAYFLRAWARYLQGDNAAALEDLQQASTLAPDDKLYSDSLQLLK